MRSPRADWTALTGRRVIVWPDADTFGRKAANKVVRLVSTAGAASVVEVALAATEFSIAAGICAA